MDIGNRIIILGCPGSGKSTLARRLHEKTGLPLFHLDNIWWRADRTHISREEFDRRLEALTRGERWIIDGDYSRTYEARIRTCDAVVFLDYGEEACMDGVRERVGVKRADMPWVEGELSQDLVRLVRSYRRENRPAVYALLEKYPEKRAFIFRTRAEAGEWVDGLE